MLLACCGIDCEGCAARKATLSDDQALREATALQWTQEYHHPFTAADIHCTGCRADGVKVGHCSECAVRRCAIAKGVAHCGDCKVNPCATLDGFYQILPPALAAEFGARLKR